MTGSKAVSLYNKVTRHEDAQIVEKYLIKFSYSSITNNYRVLCKYFL